jgi:hypothetical protein
MYGEGMYDIGRANQDSKEDNIGYLGAGGVLLWCYYEINLFGDPSLKLRDPKPPDHDISVPVMEAPSHVAPNTNISINATILNRGYCNESDINVNLTVDGSVISNITIPFLKSLESTEVSFNWTPTLGIFNLSVEATPIPNELILINNIRSQWVIVEPDIAVKNAVFDIPIYLIENTTITAEVENIGQTTVSDVKVILYADSVEVYNDTISTLDGGEKTYCDLNWTPQAAGDCAISIFAVNLTNEHSIEDNYFNKTVTVKVRPEIDVSPGKFELTLAQGTVQTEDLIIYNNGTSELIYETADYSSNGQHRKILLLSDRQELLNITDTLSELGLYYDVLNNNSQEKYTEDYDVLKQYGLIIYYSASRRLSANEKLTLDRYLTEHGGNLIVSGYDSLGSPTDFNMAYLVRSRYYYDGPWWYGCVVTDGSHPIMETPFGSMDSSDEFFASNFDHDRALPDPFRGSKAIATVASYSKILVTDSIQPSGAKVVYWNGNRFTQDWDYEGSECEMLFKNLLVWASSDERFDWLTSNPQNGQIQPYYNQTTISYKFNTTGLTAGTYYRNIVIASNDTDEPDVIIPVKLTVPVPDHDIAVSNMTGPDSLAIKETAYYNTTVKNIGLSTESDLNIHFKIDNQEIESTFISNLAPEEEYPVSFQYTANSSLTPGYLEFAISADPVPYENGTFNNKAVIDVDIKTRPEIVLTPENFDLKCFENETVVDNLSIVNSGSDTLSAELGTYYYVLEDKFLTTTLNSTKWVNSSGTPLIRTWGINEPSSPYSLNLDGLEDIVESIPINLSNATFAQISFYVEWGGPLYRPREISSLNIDYFASNQTWLSLFTINGTGPYFSYGTGNITYDFYNIKLPDNAFHSDFRYRFRSYSTFSGYDDWFIDDVKFEYLAQSPWLTTNLTNSTLVSYDGAALIELSANMTGKNIGMHYGEVYILSSDPMKSFTKLPLNVTVLGDLNHIHMSQSVWMGTADETVLLSATGHDVLHHEVPFTEYWSTTDPNGIVKNGLYSPGKTGTWKVFCNNSDNSISNYTTVTVSTGILASINITPYSWSGNADDSVDFTATGYDEDGNAMTFGASWSTTDPRGTISITGTYTAGKVGTWTVNCTNVSRDITASVQVTVNGPTDAIRIELLPETFTMTTDDTKVFSATLYDKFDNIVNAAVSWSVSGGGSIDTVGEFSPDKVGVWTITATSGGLSDTARVYVNTGVLASIELTPADIELKAGSWKTFTCTGYDADGNTQGISVQWAVSGGGTVDSNGLFKAKTVGEWTIYANVSSFSAAGSITIKPGDLSRIEINPKTTSITAGQTLTLTATGYDNCDNIIEPLSIEWSAFEKAGQFSSPGKFVGTKTGNWLITARAEGTPIQDKMELEILPGKLSTLIVSPSETEISAGNKIQFSVKGYDQYSNIIEPLTVEWSMQGGGDIDADTGEVMPRKVGTWTVKAESEGVICTSELSILPGTLETLSVNPKVCNLTAGTKEQFSVIGFDKYQNQLLPTQLSPDWYAEGGGIITEGGQFTAVLAGSCRVTAECSGKSAAADVFVHPGPLVKLDIDPGEYVMYINEQVSFKVKGYDLYNNIITDMPIDWDIPAGAGTIDAENTFTAKKVGEWAITASSPVEQSKLSATVSMTVLPRDDTDSDSDGMPDVWETRYGLNPEIGADAASDLDSDNLTNLEEYQKDTNPNGSDTDGDGMPDGWEIFYGFDPKDISGDNGYDGDPDDDGYPNLGEYNLGSDPRDPLDPKVEQIPDKTKIQAEDKESGRGLIVPILIVIIAICTAITIFYIMFKRQKKEPPIF